MTLNILQANRFEVAGKTADDFTVGTWFQDEKGFIFCIALDTATSTRRLVRCGGKENYIYISNMPLKHFEVRNILKPDTILKVKRNHVTSNTCGEINEAF